MWLLHLVFENPLLTAQIYNRLSFVSYHKLDTYSVVRFRYSRGIGECSEIPELERLRSETDETLYNFLLCLGHSLVLETVWFMAVILF